MLQATLLLPRTEVEKSWEATLAQSTESAAAKTHQKLRDSAFEITPIAKFDAPALLPGIIDSARGQVIPADASVIAGLIPGYRELPEEEFKALDAYSKLPENYGTAPGAAAALITSLAKVCGPTAFVFGTGKGRVEQLIAEANPKMAITTLDIPQELIGNCLGTPDGNNLRYRSKLGISSTADIGTIFNAQPEVSRRVHQLLGDSFSFEPKNLSGTQRLIFVDACHKLPNALMDLANSLQLAHSQGAVIVVDDFRKGSPLNAGVEAALVTFSQITGLSIIQPCPKPQQSGLKAEAGLVIIPAEFLKQEKVKNLVEALKDYARSLKSWEIRESAMSFE